MTFSESLQKSMRWYKKLVFLRDGFIGSQRLYFIQKDTTTTRLSAPLIQTRSYSRISDKATGHMFEEH